jgi:glycosyltransferase involved in cell wall biosynthesis
LRFCFLASRDWAHPEAAGGDFYLSNLARSLVNRGHKVIYFSASPGGTPGPQNPEGVEVRRLKPGLFYPIRLVRQLIRVRRSVDITVEEIFGGKRIPTLAYLYSGSRLIAMWYQSHSRIFEEQYPRGLATLLSFVERVLARLYRKCPIATLSEKSASELASMGIDKLKIGIVPSAAIIDHPRTDELPHFEDREDIMIFIGKIRKYKRVDHALFALKSLLTTNKSCRLLVAGSVARDDLDYLTSLRQQARLLGVEDSVDFRIYPGAIPPTEKAELLKRCKLLLQPSPVEGFSMTTVEANVCGTPVVVSDGVPRDAVRHGENGLVYPFGDTEIMSKLCASLMEDKATWEKLSTRGLEMAGRFSWNASTNAFEQFIESQGLGKDISDPNSSR